MKFQKTPIAGLFLIELEAHIDSRGWFARCFCEKEFEKYSLETHYPQCNISYNKLAGTIRGMHYQRQPHTEAKLIRCISGSIYDVVIDLRSDSASFGTWQAFELSASNGRMLYVPKGLAHGFQSLEDNSQVFYQMSNDFKADFSEGIRWNDPLFNIKWPLDGITISDRDRNLADFHHDKHL